MSDSSDCVDHNKLWKILKEMGIPDHLTCLLRNLYAGQEATVRTGRGTTDWLQIGKGVCQGCMLSLCLFNFYAEYIMRNLCAGQEATVRTGHGTMELGKEYIKAVYCHPVWLTLQSTSCEMPDWMKHKLELRLLEEISIISYICR